MKSAAPAKSRKSAHKPRKAVATVVSRRTAVDWKTHHRRLQKMGCRPGTLADVMRINAVIAGEG